MTQLDYNDIFELITTRDLFLRFHFSDKSTFFQHGKDYITSMRMTQG